ncbi:MAG TPA: hypothetical protein VL172_17745 [Kofleriaceae bacterium]|nr:hypothetical protein [Kofleriaceae bacterium]
MGHDWHFFRAGGVDQVSLRNGADLLALRELDQKLWVALAMPTRDVDIDAATLDLLDTDHDGRIRVPDILEAIEFVRASWTNADRLLEGGDSLPLLAITDGPVRAAARRVLSDLGKPAADRISLTDAMDVAKAFAGTILNGDGVIIAESTDDPEVRAVLQDVLAALGSMADRSGKPGIDRGRIEAFFAEAERIEAWAATGDGDQAMHVLGESTAAAADALAAVAAKIEDYFARCRLAALDERLAAGVGPQEVDLAALAARSLSRSSEEVARLPVARIEAGRPLPLSGAVNPAWADRLAAFAADALTPLLGAREALTEADFRTVQQRLAPYLTWREARPRGPLDALALERVRALARGNARAELDKLVVADEALAGEYERIASVEKLLRFQRDLVRLLRNFVNFSEFYSKRDGIFQAGTLYLDARACELVVPVADPGKHALLAGMSAAHLVYCEISRADQCKAIAAAFTNGDTDHLVVGRNGVFYDRQGRDWDATITKIVSNPLGIRQAFWSPYKKVARLIEDQIAKRAAAADSEADAKLTAHITAATSAPPAVAPAPPPAAPAAAAPPAPQRKMDVGTVAALGVAIGGIGGMVVGLLATFTGLGAWMPLGVLAMVFLISGPSMLLAWLKLRQRNLGPLLDANGWALNGRARINVSFGAALTGLAKLPKGARRSLDDPYADKQRPWKLYGSMIFLVITAATWYAGKLDRWLPDRIRSTSVLGEYAPAYVPPPPPPDAK